MIDTIVFDLDGTLIDTLGDLATAGNRTLAAMGFPTHEVYKYRHFVGNGIPKLVWRMLPDSAGEATHAVALELFRKNYARHMNDTTAPYPGILELLAALRREGFHLGVLSNKQDEYVQQLVEGFFPGLFEGISGHSEGFAPKPDPASLLALLRRMGAQGETTLYVGDSDVDVLTAHNAQLPCCGVLWGFRGEAELAAAGAEYLVASPEQLLTLVLEP